jgi:outer membrane protein OmpA-like peptidoglycan-associated protein
MDGNKKIKILGFFIILIFTVIACQVHKPTYGSFYVETSREIQKAEEAARTSKKTSELLEANALHMRNQKIRDTFKIMYNDLKDRDFLKDSLHKVNLNRLNKSMHHLRLQLDSMQYQIEKEYTLENPSAYKVYPVQELNYTYDTLTPSQHQVQKEQIIPPKAISIAQEREIQEEIRMQKSEQVAPITSTKRSSEKTPQTKTTTASVQNEKMKASTATPVIQARTMEETTPKQSIVQGLTVTPSTRRAETLTQATMTQEKMQTESRQQNNQTRDTMYVEKPTPAVFTEPNLPMVLTAYYQIGQTQPNNEVVSMLEEVLKNNKILKVEISGYTDSTGNATVNRRITNTRINYIYNKITPLVPMDKIYIQNFGQNFASIMRVDEERRVEIRLYVE